VIEASSEATSRPRTRIRRLDGDVLKKAVEGEVIERMPCSVKLLPVPKGSTAFYDFDEYERLVEAACATCR